MKRKITAIRTPIRRQNAEDYLLITLLSFAFSVSATRLFLELTGYPQLGGGELHIAHVLWGGLFLFVASLLPLIFANRWVYTLSSLCAGIGVGLFIDEVGKFITKSNDYFYPSAAPIIYAVFLIVVLLYTRLRGTTESTDRSELYGILDDMEEVIDHDLSAHEKSALLKRLDRVKKTSQRTELVNMADSLYKFLDAQKVQATSHRPEFVDRWEKRWLAFEDRWLKRGRARAILVGAMLAWGAWALIFPLQILFDRRQAEAMAALVNNLFTHRLISNPVGLTFFEVRIGLEGSMGLLVILSAVLFLIGHEKRGLSLGYLVLVISLTIVNLLMFYFDQFSTIIGASIQFLLLVMILRYRVRFLAGIPATKTPSTTA